MRRPVKNRNIRTPDRKYNSLKLSMLVNYVMKEGKKSVAEKVVYDALEVIKTSAKIEDPMIIFDTAMKNTGPMMEIRSRRVGGANYQVPREVRPERRDALALTWILEAARGKKGKPMAEKLAEELILASKSEGEAIKKRDNVHKMAEANKAFAHFAW